jgi:hypothetical protein
MEDALIPFSHSQDLFDAAKEPRSLWLVEGAVHTGLHNKSPREWENRFVRHPRVAKSINKFHNNTFFLVLFFTVIVAFLHSSTMHTRTGRSRTKIIVFFI